jgi:Fur family ferric uptake transcriptional regulator
MTASPDAAPLVVDDLDGAVRALREAGLRLSTARRLVLEALFAAEGPVSAVHLAQTISVEESSVYRNLELLEGHGLIRHVHLGHGPGLYVLVAPEDAEYLYCSRCAKVTAVAPDRLATVRDEIRRQFGYETRFTHFAIVGLCQQCAGMTRLTTTSDTRSGGAADDHRGHRHAEPPAVAGPAADEHLHSHGDFVHSHPHQHDSGGRAHEH